MSDLNKTIQATDIAPLLEIRDEMSRLLRKFPQLPECVQYGHVEICMDNAAELFSNINEAIGLLMRPELLYMVRTNGTGATEAGPVSEIATQTLTGELKGTVHLADRDT